MRVKYRGHSRRIRLLGMGLGRRNRGGVPICGKDADVGKGEASELKEEVILGVK